MASNNHNDATLLSTAQVLLSDPELRTTVKASSVLQRNIKLYGPNNVLDYSGNNQTSWNSEGTPAIVRNGDLGSSNKNDKNNNDDHHWLCIDFGRPIQPKRIQIQFQAGFVAESMQVWLLLLSSSTNDNNPWVQMCEEELEDDHQIQTFILEDAITSITPSTTAMKLVFVGCSDFYGRIIIYQVKVYGQEVSE
jgi:hypothetical protein